MKVLPIRTFTSKLAWHFCAGYANLCCGFIYLDPKQDDFWFWLRTPTSGDPLPHARKVEQAIFLHLDPSCIIMMIITNDSWPRNTEHNAWLCITMQHGHQSWCIIMYHDDHESSTSPFSTFRAQGWFRAKKQNRNSQIVELSKMTFDLFVSIVIASEG